MRFRIKELFKRPIFFFLIMLNFMIPQCVYQMMPSGVSQLLYTWDKYIGIPVFFICILALLITKNAAIGDVITYYGYKIIGTVIVTLAISGTITGGGSFRHFRQLSAICYIALALKFNYKPTIKRLAYFLSFLVILNFLTIILFPKGMYYDGNWENYLLGYDNGHVVVFMPALFFTFEYAFLKKKYLLMIATWVSAFASAFISRSGVTVAGMAVFAILLIIIRFPGVRKFLFNWKTVLIGIAFVFVFIVLLRKQMDYRDLIMQYFGKDSTLTERTVLWDRAFGYIRENPWFGTGDNTENNLRMFLLRTQKLTYSHNEILDVLVRSGIIGFILYLNCIMRTFYIAKGRRDDHIKIWLVFMTAYWIMMLFESYSNYNFYYLYFVMMILPRYQMSIVETTNHNRKRGKLRIKRLIVQNGSSAKNDQ